MVAWQNIRHQQVVGLVHCYLRLLCLAACPGVPVQSQSAMSDVTADHFDIRNQKLFCMQ